MFARRFPMAMAAAMLLTVIPMLSPPDARGQTFEEAPLAVYDVAARDDDFSPPNLTIPVGSTVRWTNHGTRPHTTTSDSGLWDSGALAPGMSFSHTFASEGTFDYRCAFHANQGMVARVVVTSAGTTPPTALANLAQGRPVRASTSQSGHPPELAVDGDPSTYWASAGLGAWSATNDAGAPDAAAVVPQADGRPVAADGAIAAPAFHNVQWFMIDLGREMVVEQFDMLWSPTRYARSYGVYAYGTTCSGWCRLGFTNSGDGDDRLSLQRPVHARHFLLLLTYANVPYGGYHLREWRIYGEQPGPVPITNLARGRPAVASSSRAGHGPMHVTDGDPGTDWRSVGVPAWLYVDLGRAASLTRAELHGTPSMAARQFAIYAHSGVGWYRVYATSFAGGTHASVPLTGVRTRHLLVYAWWGETPSIGLREFEIFGAYPAAAAAAIADEGWAAEPDTAVPDVTPPGAGAEPLRLPDGAPLPSLEETR